MQTPGADAARADVVVTGQIVSAGGGNGDASSSSTAAAPTVTRSTLLYYHYVHVADRAELARWLEGNARELGLVGRVRVAHDGLNATLGAPTRDRLERHADAVTARMGGAHIDFKYAASHGARSAEAVAGCRFDAFEAKVVEEIVTMQLPRHVADPKNGGEHLAPREFHDGLVRGEADVLIDIRNAYEHTIGRFSAPPGVELILPNVRTFAEMPAFLDEAAPSLRGRRVFLYCTGGVRCERASAYLREKGEGFEKVFQLSGGIQRYLEAAEAGALQGEGEGEGQQQQVGGEEPAPAPAHAPAPSAPSSASAPSLWEGKLFVFDERRPVRIAGERAPEPGYRPSARVLGECVTCGAPHDEYAWLRCGRCSVLVLVCDACAVACGEGGGGGGGQRGGEDVRTARGLLRCGNCKGKTGPTRRTAGKREAGAGTVPGGMTKEELLKARWERREKNGEERRRRLGVERRGGGGGKGRGSGSGEDEARIDAPAVLWAGEGE